MSLDVTAETASVQYANSKPTTTVTCAFLVEDKWLDEEEFFAGAKLGQQKSKVFDLPSLPTKLKISVAKDSKNDRWAFWKLSCAGITLVEHPNGATGVKVKESDYWLDGGSGHSKEAGGSITSHEYDLDSGQLEQALSVFPDEDDDLAPLELEGVEFLGGGHSVDVTVGLRSARRSTLVRTHLNATLPLWFP